MDGKSFDCRFATADFPKLMPCRPSSTRSSANVCSVAVDRIDRSCVGRSLGDILPLDHAHVGPGPVAVFITMLLVPNQSPTTVDAGIGGVKFAARNGSQ
jgi:hypothetical protein